MIGYNEEELTNILNHIDSFYYEYSEIKYKDNGEPKTKNGEIQKRYYTPSCKSLKDIQNKIQSKILSKVTLLPNIKGGVKGNSNVSNAKPHKGKQYRFQTDLTNFFPSVTPKMVYSSLRAKGFSKQVADITTKLTTIRTADSWDEKSLPQGAPTSPMLANIVFEKVDIQISKLIIDKNIVYTRWIDDLTFSSEFDFQDLINPILSLIGKSGFKISRKKTTYKKNKSVVTGVIVGMSTMKVTEEFRQKDNGNLSQNQLQGRKAYKDYVHKVDKSPINVTT
ncbi:reverse transcriptase family protein [Draconibacterium orientale]|uniref:reverse transcriptase family protein n=1 Tax=Draconibacterium orientale TaxID=1168034 RepID=UPI0029C03EFA|nr:reverse transcriptase family protein [Draconibacterium orientale]